MNAPDYNYGWKRSQNVFIVLLLGITVSVTGTIPVEAQNSNYPMNETKLAQMVSSQDNSDKNVLSIQFANVTLKKALELLAEEINVGFSIKSDLIPDKKVSLSMSNIRAHEVIYKLLEGTNLEPVLPPSKDVIVIREKDELPAVETLEQTITGTVVDLASGEALPGVNVIAGGTEGSGSPIGTTTNMDGQYEIEVPDDINTLIFSFVGYRRLEVTIEGRTEINVELSQDIQLLQDVVVIGYGTQEARDVTGSISQVDSEELEQVPAANFESALDGRASGVMVTQNTGQPGGRTQVRIRGGNSMIGSNEPLYVVDGFPLTNGIDNLDPSDIETINILKDASATAIYGARGANGVVLITTKTGSNDQPVQVSIQSYYGFQNESKRLEVLNAEQYATVANEFLKNEGLEPFFEISGNTVTDGDGNTTDLEGIDWQDAAYQTPSPVQKHSINFTGGAQNTSYSMSFNYFDQEGIIYNSGAKRGNLRLNLNHDLHERLNLIANINISKKEVNNVPVNNRTLYEILGLSAPPTYSIRNDEGLPRRIAQSYFFASEDMGNPLSFRDPYKDRNLTNSVTINGALDVEIFEGLRFNTRFGLETAQNRAEAFEPIIYSDDRGFASEQNSSQNSFLNENTLNYITDIGRHSLDVVGGFTYQDFSSRFSVISVSRLPNNITENFDLGSATEISPPSSGISEWKLLSGLGRINYSFDDKYLVTVSFRADGSSRFGDQNKWGYFPSAALAWRMSSESFMDDVEFINDLKLRTSFGVTGNTALTPYQSLSRLSTVRTVYGDNQDLIGFTPANIANADLKWETTTQTDIGFEVSLFEGVVNFSADYYQKVTDNLLASVPLPLSSGFNSVLRNIGEIKNSGIELSVDATPLRDNFRWDVSAHFSTNNNEVISLAGGSDILGGSLGLPFGAGINIAREGEPFGAFYGFEEIGIDPETGQRIVKDQNGDGIINDDDRTILGSPHPDYMFSLNNTFFYKNFSLNIFLNGVIGQERYWAASAPHLNSFQRGHNQLADFWGNYWTEENPNNAKYPKVSSETFVLASDKYLHDASFIRVKTLSLTYDFPVTRISALDRLQVYVSADNLFTFTDYPGRDPNLNTLGNNSQDVANRLQMGINGGAYPTAKTFLLGTKINF